MSRGLRRADVLIAVVVGLFVVIVTPGPAMAVVVALFALLIVGLTVLWDRRTVRRRSARGGRRPPRRGGRRPRQADRRATTARRRTIER